MIKPGKAVEMTGYGKRGKPNPGFPPFPQPLEIAARFPHSHSPDYQFSISKKNSRKETPPRIASLPPSGSLFNENMLARLAGRSRAGRTLDINQAGLRRNS